MSQVLIRTVQGPPDIMLFLQRTHQRYQESLKEAQNQTPPHLVRSSYNNHLLNVYFNIQFIRKNN